MISQALFFSFSAHPQRMLSGAIAPLGLLLFMALNLSPVYSQGQPGGSQLSTPSASGAASGAIPSNRSVLKQGSQGDAVSDLQALLKLLGFYTGAIDGVYRENTASAVSAFQQAAGLQADGIVGSDTWARLLPPSPVVNGAAAANSPASGVGSGGGAIASSNTPAPASTSGNAFPSPTASPIANSSVPSPTAQLPSASGTAASPVPTVSPAAQTPTPQASPAQASPTQTSAPAPTSTPVDLPILRVGMRGSAVNGLQERLKAIGAFKGVIDGVFGLETQEAVKTAQRSFNLEPDGIVGPATWTALLR